MIPAALRAVTPEVAIKPLIKELARKGFATTHRNGDAVAQPKPPTASPDLQLPGY